MIISIHQPDYIPYMGYFYKIFKSDVFVFLDDCQFSNDNMHHWNKIKTPQGELRLKIPVKSNFGDRINTVRSRDDLGWKYKHLKTIEMNYRKSIYFKEIFPKFEELLLSEYPNIGEMNIAINKWISYEFNIKPYFIRSSELNITSTNENRIVDICKRLGGTEYFSGNGAKVYQKDANFNENGLKLTYTDYKTIEYKQIWGNFIPNMSIVDYIFNCGFNNPFNEGEI